MVSRYADIKSIGSRVKHELSIPISTGGVGNARVKSNHCIFQMKLRLFNGSEATFSGVCLDQIKVKFPQYRLKGKVEENIAAGSKRQGNNPRDLLQLPQFVGVIQIHIGNQVSEVLSRKSVPVTIWAHNIQTLVQECRWY